jgi:hypothetical protein
MAEYMIESEHSPEECSELLNEMVAYDKDLMEAFFWGCKSGVHKGWLMVEADNADDVREVLLPSIRNKTVINAVSRFSGEELKKQHEQAS